MMIASARSSVRRRAAIWLVQLINHPPDVSALALARH
jgi:hypothetical protein